MAVGERLSIGIRRHFTREGRHPYEDVEWERRDSRISDYRTGAVAFEQLDVEVPADWSVNATNILAQKYFRGTLGTPERESSLRQVVDRVTDTITAWGLKDGYFEDAAEASTFSDELKHLIVEQKAAFNSPVWFNIGVAGVPQQASACFILSVDDTMSSILNWYTEEGTIFKGGSGAGANLSRIRSSRELLNGGGTASGPVSFMRGADASAGTIKSGGKTRRAAKMVILDADHPDIQEFIWCKAKEERKARVLSLAGFDMDLDGADGHSIQYQNANNSVRVTDEFMQAVLEGRDWELSARTTGEVLETIPARDLFHQIAEAAWECADPGLQFDTTINKWHTAPNTGRITASNPCSEYVHLDNSSCNLASLNLLEFLDEHGRFDVSGFEASIEVVFTAQEILVGNADYPTDQIAETTRRFRELGLGYANLGALLMAWSLPYDSDEGRALAGALTALMTGRAYEVSARTAARMGPFAGYHENREEMLNVLRMHRAEVAKIDEELVPTELLSAAQEAWDGAVELAEQHGVRNSQATVLAPTGCLVGGTLVPTDRGLVRLRSLGDPEGPRWQPLGVQVATDQGSRTAAQFYVNGLVPVADIVTRRGFHLRGTPQHRVKVVDRTTGEWVWRCLGDLRPRDLVPLAMGSLLGEVNEVPLPPAPDHDRTGEHRLMVPRIMSPELAELVGYFMGDGSLRRRGLRFCVSDTDLDVVARLEVLCKEVLGIAATTRWRQGRVEVRIDSVSAALWWEACGLVKREPRSVHSGGGHDAQVPDAVLHSNDPEVYRSFIRGLLEADGALSAGCPTLRSASLQLAEDVQGLLLALGYPTTRVVEERNGALPLARLRLSNPAHCRRFMDEIGFIGEAKSAAAHTSDLRQRSRGDDVPMTRELIDELAPRADGLRKTLLMEHRRAGTVSRRAATELLVRTDDERLRHLLSFFYDQIAEVGLDGEELTYDLSVPANVTYVANGFVSHNTISFLMDCDTTGIEPDLGLVKTKKLVGGGTMSIVNQTVPRALKRLGYDEDTVASIVSYIAEHHSIVGSTGFSAEHLPVFACSMGDNVIHHSGHVRMMAAAQPFISGSISKTVNTPEQITVEEIEQLHIDAWRMGLKSIAIYRDNCKVAQPLSTSRRVGGTVPPIAAGDVLAGGAAAEEADAAVLDEIARAALAAREAELTARISELEVALQASHVTAPAATTRKRLPRKRRSNTFAFRVADCEGYVTVGEYEDGRPGEVFMKVSKQGSTLSGVMDAFSMAVSFGLQHGVPLSTFVRHYTNMRFEPAGITDDQELRIASSLVDYIFRRLALDYLSYDERLDLGVLSVGERTQPTLPGLDEVETARAMREELERYGKGGDAAGGRPADGRPADGHPADGHPAGGQTSAGGWTGAGTRGARVGPSQPEDDAAGPARSERLRAGSRDAPFCYACGNLMQRAGSCYACPSCGATSGCS
ncbi:MAG: vitamin B12-dependent ribonucleotide reductase [Acidimicrobiales bacterium]